VDLEFPKTQLLEVNKIDWSEVAKYKFGFKRCAYCYTEFREYTWKNLVCIRHKGAFATLEEKYSNFTFFEPENISNRRWTCCMSSEPMAIGCGHGPHSFAETLENGSREKNMFWSLSTLLNIQMR